MSGVHLRSRQGTLASRDLRSIGLTLCVAIAVGACDSGSSSGPTTTATDAVTEVFVPNDVLFPDTEPSTDTEPAPDAEPTTAPDTAVPDTTELDDTDETTAPDTTVAPDTTTDTGVTTVPDTTPDTSDVPPAPECGDDACNGSEDCLSCSDDCTCPAACGADLFISEYLEGSTGFDKALEIANETGRRVQLGGYALWKITNGGMWTEADILPLTGTLEPGDVVVVCHAQAEPSLLARCDIKSSSDALEWNGDDAVGLAKNGAVIDAVGGPGASPGTAWAAGGVVDATKDHRMVRNADVLDGEPNWTIASAQWAVGPPDHGGFGSHAVAATCAAQSPPRVQINEARAGATDVAFIEVATGPDAAVDLQGWRLVSTSGQYTFPAGPTVPANAYRSVSKSALGFSIGAVDMVWLYDPQNVQQDLVGWAAAEMNAGQAWGRLPNFIGAFQSLSRATPGAANENPDHFCGDDTCDDDEDCTTCVVDCGQCRPWPGELVVTEVLSTPSSGPEWIEIVSVAVVPLELAGLGLTDLGSDFHVIAPPGGSWVIAPGERVVLGSAAAGHIDYVYAGLSLDATNDEVVLEGDDDIVDDVAWTAAPVPPGVSWSLDPTLTDTIDNDSSDAWCAGTPSSPGNVNPTCPVANPCGDEVCDAPSEDCETCAEDCGQCPTGSCASQLFISEYVEGASFNKAIEIANFTGAPVQLNGFALRRIVNGGSNWSGALSLVLSGTLASGQVYVVCDSQASAAVKALCDLETTSQVLDFNGDDAVALAHGATVIDTIGLESVVGPWSVAGTSAGTENHVLVRKPNIASPSTNWATSSANEWSVLGPDAFTGLGLHAVDYTCGPTGP